MRRSLLSSLRAHVGRLIAACLAIVLGVGFGTLAMTAHASASHGIHAAIGDRYRGVDAVVAPRQAEIRPADVSRIGKLPEADAVVPQTAAYLQAQFPGLVRPRYLSIEPLHDTRRIAGPSTTSGRLPTSLHQIALPAKLAAKHNVKVGDSLQLRSYERKTWTVTVTGLIDDADSVGMAAAVATPQTVRAFEPNSYVSKLLVAAKPGVTPEALTAAIGDVLPSGLEVHTGKDWIEEEIKGYTNGIDVLGGVFGMFAVIALFVACLVIANTFTIVIAQRTREMALLRCVGASKRQVFSSVLAEASVVGVISSAIGVVFGVALSALGLALSREFDWGLPPFSLHLSLAAVFVPLLIGAVATIVAAVVPARRATRVAPLAALRPDAAPVVKSKAGVVRLVFGFLLLAGGGGLLALSAMNEAVLIGVAGGVVSFLGVLAIGTLLVPALIRLIGALPAKTGGVPARIALANAIRNPKRTAATTSALLIGVTLISLTCVGIASVRKTFDASMDGQYPVDLLVKSHEERLPASAGQQLRDIKGVIEAVPVPSATVKTANTPYEVYGLDPAAAAKVIHNPELAAKVRPGSVLVERQTMNGLNVREGQQLTLLAGTTKLVLTVHKSVGLEPIVVADSDLAKLAPKATVSSYWLATDPKADGSQVLEAVQQSIPSVKELSVSGGLAERTAYTKIFDVLLIIGVGLLGVSVLIALVGVGNTLSLSVLERTRENALLRAMGLSRRQLRGMLAVESLLMALVAAGLGIALGLVYGWIGTTALMGGQTVDGTVEYALPVGLLAVIAGVAAVAGLLASVLPARRAAKVAPAGALATE